MLARVLGVFLLSAASGLQTPAFDTRRNVLAAAAAAASPCLMPQRTAAAPPSAAPALTPPGTLWITGKSDPLRLTSKEKPDGTKRDGKYLGCLNDCIPRCQGPPGPSQKVTKKQSVPELSHAQLGSIDARAPAAWVGIAICATLACRLIRIPYPPSCLRRSAQIASMSARTSFASRISSVRTRFALTDNVCV